jgi:hypothetical protein
MTNVTHTRPAGQPERVAHLNCVARSETVRRGEVVPVYGASCWTRRPTGADLTDRLPGGGRFPAAAG